jgi:formate/nitrite transporter FocA (FNT family)
MLSIIAGILIALGGTAFLQTKELIGAILFSIGLLTILHYKCALFTGKAGLLVSRAIKPLELLKIYCGNLIGSISMAGLLAITPFGEKLGE